LLYFFFGHAQGKKCQALCTRLVKLALAKVPGPKFQ
jgi:hypothetical protein